MTDIQNKEIAMPRIVDILNAAGDNLQLCVTVKGTSMQPFLKDGVDKVMFTKMGDRKPRKGDILLFRRKNGNYVMHRLYSVARDGSFTFAGDAQSVAEPDILPENVVAYVPFVWRHGKKINCSHGFWRCIMTLYMNVRIKHPTATAKTLKFFARIGRAFKNPCVAIHKLKKRMFG